MVEANEKAAIAFQPRGDGGPDLESMGNSGERDEDEDGLARGSRQNVKAPHGPRSTPPQSQPPHSPTWLPSLAPCYLQRENSNSRWPGLPAYLSPSPPPYGSTFLPPLSVALCPWALVSAWRPLLIFLSSNQILLPPRGLPQPRKTDHSLPHHSALPAHLSIQQGQEGTQPVIFFFKCFQISITR